MEKSARTRAYVFIHICVAIWGFTAILGKMITLPSLALVWWRMLTVLVLLLMFPRVWHGFRNMPASLFARYAGIGALVALHWITFYASIKLANASVAATCMALGSVFVALIEPWTNRRAPEAKELFLGMVVVPGIALIVGGISTSFRTGLVAGVLSALFVAIFSALNKRFIQHADPFTITCIEMGSGWIFLTLCGPLLSDASFIPETPDQRDALLIFILAIGCTLLPFTLSLFALRHLSAFSLQLSINLEPIYTIILASLLFQEQHELGVQFYVGVAIILSVVMIHPWLTRSR